nr:MAG TPA: hypothetical protein [Caudoviricetes sp.]
MIASLLCILIVKVNSSSLLSVCSISVISLFSLSEIFIFCSIE